jgi:hypothetical protein
MLMQMCGSGMMVAGILATILGLGLLASLIVLVWVAISRRGVHRAREVGVLDDRPAHRDRSATGS